MQKITCRILTIGNELLLGETIDTNSASISRYLAGSGVEVVRKESLPDEIEVISNAIKYATEDILVLTGGLGPTPDDLTRDALANAFSVKLNNDSHQVARIRGFFKKLKRDMAACNLLQASVPQGFKAIDNDFGTAPVLFSKKPFIVALPGVPRELEQLMPSVVIPLIRKNFRCPNLYIEEIKTTGIGESLLYDRIKNIPVPKGVTFASLPEYSGVTLRFTGMDRKEVQDIYLKVKSRVHEFVYGKRGDTLERLIKDLFVKKNKTLAAAESCTGGLLASKLVSVPGSSKYFTGGVVSYSNALKELFLNVPSEILKAKGAVSSETALYMAQGIRVKTNADVGVSITGIAGPDGGTKEKPVGTVFIAVVSKNGENVERFSLFGDRKAVQERSAAMAMAMILKSFNASSQGK